MATQFWHKNIEAFSFSVTFDGLSGMLIDLDLYIFSERGELIDGQPLRRGKAVVELSKAELRDARIMVGPPINEFMRGPITMDAIRDRQGFELEFTLASEQRSLALASVPEAAWRRWQQSRTWRNDRQAPTPDILFW